MSIPNSQPNTKRKKADRLSFAEALRLAKHLETNRDAALKMTRHEYHDWAKKELALESLSVSTVTNIANEVGIEFKRAVPTHYRKRVGPSGNLMHHKSLARCVGEALAEVCGRIGEPIPQSLTEALAAAEAYAAKRLKSRRAAE